MNVKCYFLAGNPFFQAYYQSDFFGKLIFLFLFLTSIWCWSVLVYKFFTAKKARAQAFQFATHCQKHKSNFLNIPQTPDLADNPFSEIYLALKKQTKDLLSKNHRFGEERKAVFLSPSDVELIATHLASTISLQVKILEKHLYVLSMIVGLAPLLGLLGTVWGILETFTGLNSGAGGMNQAMLAGISLALTTTVAGLLIAIPALIAYSYLKNFLSQFEIEMENFATELLSSVELQYRKVD